MSKETSFWLNTMTLIGQTLNRGKAWHYREENQGDESNHYQGFIPVEDVLRRLFNFKVVEAPMFVQLPNGEMVEVVDRKLMVTDDDYTVLGAFKDGYAGHDYEQWLISNVSRMLDDSVNISSAGLLRNRGQAWVEVSVPESVKTPEGVEYRPNIIACTSFDGTLATTYKRTVTNVVCDNTLFAGLSEKGQVFKARHSKNSGMKLQKAKDALHIVHEVSTDFEAEVKRLCETMVTDKQWAAVLDQLVPVPTGEDASKRGITVAENKREKLQTLWDHDSRVAPWANTGWGVTQAFNTFHHHFSTVKGDQHRGTRNMDDALSGRTQKGDLMVIEALELVLSNN